MAKNFHIIQPRYTFGKPSVCSYEILKIVVDKERREFYRIKNGVDSILKERAERRSMDRIAILKTDIGNGKYANIDLITNARWTDAESPPKEEPIYVIGLEIEADIKRFDDELWAAIVKSTNAIQHCNKITDKYEGKTGAEWLLEFMCISKQSRWVGITARKIRSKITKIMLDRNSNVPEHIKAVIKTMFG